MHIREIIHFYHQVYAMNTNTYQEAIHLSSEFQLIINEREFASHYFSFGNILEFQNASVRKFIKTKSLNTIEGACSNSFFETQWALWLFSKIKTLLS